MTKKYILYFHQKATEKPITYMLVKKYDIRINIISAKIDAGEEGTLVLEMTGDRLDEAIRFIEEEGVEISEMKEEITLDLERCVHCGACTAVCPTGALSMDRESFEVVLRPDQCVACGVCVRACPRKAVTLHL